MRREAGRGRVVMIKSKKRVKKFGEVFTNPREVKAMCDLVDSELKDSIFATYLEPSCGEGAFLIEILNRKLQKVTLDQYFPITFLASLASIYGIEIQKDNIEICRGNLFNIFESLLTERLKSFQDQDISIDIDEVRIAARAIIKSNIIWGDFLSGQDLESGQEIQFFSRKIHLNLGFLIEKKAHSFSSMIKEEKLK